MLPTVPFSPDPAEPPAAPPELPTDIWQSLSPQQQTALREWYEDHRRHLLHQLYRILLIPRRGTTQPTGREIGINLLLLGYLLRIPPLDLPTADHIRRGWNICKGLFSQQKQHLERTLRSINPRITTPHRAAAAARLGKTKKHQ